MNLEKFLNPKIMKATTIFLLTSFVYTNLFSQNFGSTKDPIVLEKVYLHTDRSNYFSGENIWFKAYMVDASSNMLIDHSKNLYVELISPENVILQKRLVQIQDSLGTGFGDFHLSDSIQTGHYIIRAYTNWMRNFGDAFFFEKQITIFNSNFTASLQKQNFSPTKSAVDLQFFPEGGSFVDSIPTKLAFKAVDSSGIGCDIKGTIQTKSGKVVSTFESSHLGMGICVFTPFANESYSAIGVTKNGQEFTQKLPEAFKTGITLEVRGQNATDIFISIKTNRKTLQQYVNKIFKLRISYHNEEYMVYDVKISSLANRFSISTVDLPEGINQITLLSYDEKPQCERLVYINKKQEYKLSLSSDTTAYKPRSEVKLNVSVTDTLGTPEPSTVSLSAVDASIENNPSLSWSNIRSYLLLESELKGRIEQPDYYFYPSNEDRWKKLDLLLLTQGWRDFIWKYTPSNTIVPQYPLETGINLSGKLKRAVMSKPINKANVTLTLIDDSLRYYAFTRTDSLGRFRFDSLYFSGVKKIILSAKADNKMLQEVIDVDSIEYNSPDLDSKLFSNNNDLLLKGTQLSDDPLFHRTLKKKYSLTDTIVLDELIIKKYIPINRNKDNHVRIYNTVDQTILVKEKDAGYSDIFSLIRGKIPNIMVTKDVKSGLYFVKLGGVRTLGYGTSDVSPLFLLNGIPTTTEVLLDVPVYTVDKIEVLKRNASIFGSNGYNGVISIHTKNGQSYDYGSITSTIKKNIIGYDAPRLFYAPKYNTPTNEPEKLDQRTTIYWEPNIITTSEKGENINFFNADKVTTVLIKAEGITQSGKPVTGFLKYEVR